MDSRIQPPGRKDGPTVEVSGQESFKAVDGVEVVRLGPIADGRGSLTPFVGHAEGFWHEPIVYAYSVMLRPGVIKGWGMHRLQADRYFVPAGRLRVVLYDGRVDSATFQAVEEIWFSYESAGLVRIPPGVWHADQNWGDRDAWLVNFPTRPYDPADPDKYRLDPHGADIPFDWTIRDG
jgi:dTDP-4-dehydrorhamnose 3,5-epimerase